MIDETFGVESISTLKTKQRGKRQTLTPEKKKKVVQEKKTNYASLRGLALNGICIFMKYKI